VNEFVRTTSLRVALIPTLALACCSPIEPAKDGSKENVATTASSVFDAAPASTAGNWIDVPYDPANFRCGGDGCTWTVTKAQQINYSYTVIGKTMIVVFTIQGTTTKSPAVLNLKVPGGYTVARRSDASPIRCYDGKSWVDGYAVMGANAAFLQLYFEKGALWPNGSLEVSGNLVLSVN